MSGDGQLVISLDFELFWGVHDYRAIDECRDRLMTTREVVPALLDTFEQFDVRATWATVGFLFADGRDEALAHSPDDRPTYECDRYSPYPHLERTGTSEADDPLHFAPSLIERIRETPGQEIGSHTFSHYFCLEEGQRLAAWRADLSAARAIAERRGVDLTSLVFPRNQVAPAYVEAAGDAGFASFRGPPGVSFYEPWARDGRTVWGRAARLLDAHVPLAGPITHELDGAGRPVDVPASRMLRPWRPATAPFAPLRGRRIRREMRTAAENGECFHLWWHPHNFGAFPEQNLSFLRRILGDFAELRADEGMKSVTMAEVA
ncbi:MAG: polysaccharide deacetylase family protein [Bradymonadaceae bacterium]